MVDERCCRGDGSAPKSEASNAPVAVQRHIIERIHALKLKTVTVRAGTAVRRYKLIKSDGPDDLVFQSVRDGKPMRDNNILSRFIKPAARKLGLGFVNWRCLITSYGTWLRRRRHERHSGADAALADFYDNGHLRSRHSRVAETNCREAARANDGAVKFWNVLERNAMEQAMQVIDSMVARDGVEPPTPAFSECSYPIPSTTCRSRTAA